MSRVETPSRRRRRLEKRNGLCLTMPQHSGGWTVLGYFTAGPFAAIRRPGSITCTVASRRTGPGEPLSRTSPGSPSRVPPTPNPKRDKKGPRSYSGSGAGTPPSPPRGPCASRWRPLEPNQAAHCRGRAPTALALQLPQALGEEHPCRSVSLYMRTSTSRVPHLMMLVSADALCAQLRTVER